MKFILILLSSIILMANAPKVDQNDPAFKLYFKAYEFVLDEQWDSAIKSFGELTQKYKKSNYYDDAYYWIAYATNEKGNLERAYDLFSDFVKEFPKSNLIENANRDIKVIAEHQIDKGKTHAKYKQAVKDYDNSREDFEAYELQEQVVFAIYNQGGKTSSEKLYKIVMNKKRPLEIREKALFWLGQTESYSVKKMLKMFNTLEEEELKEKAIFGISQHEGKEAQDALLKIALDKSINQNYREKAIFWISQTNDRTVMPYLKTLLEKVEHTELREKVIFSLSQSGSKEANELLTKIAFDKKEQMDVREKAIFWLGQNGDVNNLKRIYLQMEHPELQEKLIFSFSQSGEGEAEDFLIKLLKLKTTTTKLKKKIIFWLGQSNSSKARKAISDILND